MGHFYENGPFTEPPFSISTLPLLISDEADSFLLFLQVLLRAFTSVCSKANQSLN